eukprot:scaffold3_cov108-Isochrysis_galbana.AAC.7
MEKVIAHRARAACRRRILRQVGELLVDPLAARQAGRSEWARARPKCGHEPARPLPLPQGCRPRPTGGRCCQGGPGAGQGRFLTPGAVLGGAQQGRPIARAPWRKNNTTNTGGGARRGCWRRDGEPHVYDLRRVPVVIDGGGGGTLAHGPKPLRAPRDVVDVVQDVLRRKGVRPQPLNEVSLQPLRGPVRQVQGEAEAVVRAIPVPNHVHDLQAIFLVRLAVELQKFVAVRLPESRCAASIARSLDR